MKGALAPVWLGLKRWLSASGIAGETEAQRSSERNRRAITSSAAALALRGSSFIVVLVSVPLTVSFLGPVRFGMWLTISSVVALLAATDLGIGNGVLNNVALAFGRGDRGAARGFLASGFVALVGLSATFGVLFVGAYSLVPWASLYNVSGDPQAAAEAGPATAALVATFLISLPLGLVAHVRAAYQEGFVQSAFVGLGNLLTLALLLLAIQGQASLPLLVVALTIGPIVAALINIVVLFRVQRPWLLPRRLDVTAAAIRSVLSVGLAFTALQIAYVVGFSSDRLVAAQVVGPVAVADYSVAYRLFSIPAGLAAIAMLPLWPAYREAISRSDIRWVRQTLRRSLVIALVVTAPTAAVITVAGPNLVSWWTGGSITPPLNLYPALGAFTVAFAVATVLAVLFNGAQAMRFQVVTMTIMAALNISTSIFLASRIGVAGVAVGSLLAVCVALILPGFVYAPRLIRNLGQLPSRVVAARALGGGNGLNA